jgi:hypothetical protein
MALADVRDGDDRDADDRLADGERELGVPDPRSEPEPDWVEGIRRGRRERAERLKKLLHPAERRPSDGRPAR